jgi:hypothetical protein
MYFGSALTYLDDACPSMSHAVDCQSLCRRLEPASLPGNGAILSWSDGGHGSTCPAPGAHRNDMCNAYDARQVLEAAIAACPPQIPSREIQKNVGRW